LIMLKELGANVLKDGRLGFLVWAPLRKSVGLEFLTPRKQMVPMDKLENGYFGATVPDQGGDVQYLYVLDGSIRRPDPASRFQPLGVHGPSALARHGEFKWEDTDCLLPELRDYITYELHVGTFTPEGTFTAIIPLIPYLKEVGITAVELMPISQFPGARNWGYDGVHPYAAQNTYGGPQGLMELVNACHKNGIAVVLDVVYNHLGPEGNYLGDFGPYFTDRYHGPWGDAINLDGPGSADVRKFFTENACYWLGKYHIDALRIDAIHGIFDNSKKHFLRELKETVKARIKGRPAYLVAESDLNDVRVIEPPESGGYGLDAQWNDDFHHALHTLLTGESDGYYMDFGNLGQLAKALREGFVYSGQQSKFRERRHGSSTAERPAKQLVVFSQNHDQVGNRRMGDRLAVNLSTEKLQLAAAIVLLSPNLPLLFMGEEYGETAPFQYFVSHSDPGLVEAVRKGREKEFSKFQWQGETPDPQSENTFNLCKINPELRHKGRHKELFEFYKTLISLRKEHPALFASGKDNMEVREYPEQRSLLVRRWHYEEQFLLAASFNDSPVTIKYDVPDGRWRKMLGTSPEDSGQKDEFSGMIDIEFRLKPYCFCLYKLLRQPE
jgi:maltooligosyltrehalose trehalohydrolase